MANGHGYYNLSGDWVGTASVAEATNAWRAERGYSTGGVYSTPTGVVDTRNVPAPTYSAPASTSPVAPASSPLREDDKFGQRPGLPAPTPAPNPWIPITDTRAQQAGTIGPAPAPAPSPWTPITDTRAQQAGVQGPVAPPSYQFPQQQAPQQQAPVLGSTGFTIPGEVDLPGALPTIQFPWQQTQVDVPDIPQYLRDLFQSRETFTEQYERGFTIPNEFQFGETTFQFPWEQVDVQLPPGQRETLVPGQEAAPIVGLAGQYIQNQIPDWLKDMGTGVLDDFAAGSFVKGGAEEAPISAVDALQEGYVHPTALMSPDQKAYYQAYLQGVNLTGQSVSYFDWAVTQGGWSVEEALERFMPVVMSDELRKLIGMDWDTYNQYYITEGVDAGKRRDVAASPDIAYDGQYTGSSGYFPSDGGSSGGYIPSYGSGETSKSWAWKYGLVSWRI